MRALMLAVGFVLAATAPAFAADRKIEDFFGRYLGQGAELKVDPAQPLGKPPQKRMSEVIIEPAKEKDGFIISWSTMRAKDLKTPGANEADVKTYHQVFHATDQGNFFTEENSGDPVKG